MRPAVVSFLSRLRRRFSRREGQTLVEYTLILGVLTVVMVSVMTLLGKQIIVVFSAITTILDTAQSSH